jgi:beta-galactosidase/beta-glucuronidase
VTDGNQLVAPLKDSWQFQIDSTGVGEDIGWWKKELTGGNWQQILTATSSWSDQGLRYYKGLAWYRQSITIPAKFNGQRVFLWFGGVDEKAKVWVNSKMVGISHGGAFVPFEFDATEAVLPGKENIVTVLVCNKVVDELGTGGIMAPVMFYSPVAGKTAVPENIRPMGRTFP